MPHEQERHGRLEWAKALVVDRSRLIAVVERPEHDSVLDVRRNGNVLQDLVKDASCTFSRQVHEDDDDHVVVRAVAVSRSTTPFEEPALVAVHQLDDVWHAPVADLLGSEPERLPFDGPRHEGADGPGATELVVRPDDEGLDPFSDGAQRVSVTCRKITYPSVVLEIFKKKKISGLC
jgi:hypothetical protein